MQEKELGKENVANRKTENVGRSNRGDVQDSRMEKEAY